MSFTLSSRDKKNLGWPKIFGLLAVAGVVITLTGLSVYWLSTKDKLDGEYIAPGVNNPVTIKFDEHAIPHISANNVEDAWYTLGFLHATERPWQMEFNRRLASGKLSEILGTETIGVDKFIRTLGIRRAAEKQFENYPIVTGKQIGRAHV